MTIFFHKILDAETERQYNCFQNEQIIKIQNKQKVLILLLISVFTIQKGIEKSWTSLSFNLFGFIFITISYKFVKKASMYYKYLLLVIVLIFNIFYPLNRYIGTIPNQDTYLDGYFICLGSLSILNSVEAQAKYMVMIPILVFNLYVGPYNETGLWSQGLKFGIMTVMDIQFGIQQEIYRRKQFFKLNCNKIIQNYFNSQDLFDIFKVKFDENVKSIKLSSLLEKQKFNEFQQLDFKQRIRKILVHPKKYNTEMKKKNQQNQFQWNKINLETFLLYFLKGIKPKTEFKLFESFKNKLKVELEEISIKNLVQNEISTFNSKQIVIYKIHHYKTPQALIILKQHQISTKIKKLKLKQENYKLIIKYFISIFNSSFKKCLTILQDFNQICEFNINSQQQLIFREHHTQLNKAWNSFRNMVDFMQLSCNINPLATFNILQMIEQLIQAVKYLHHDNVVDLEIINKLKSSFVVSNNAKMKQLFLNLFYYILDLNYGKIQIILQEEQNSNDNIIDVKIKYQRESIFTKSELSSFPIINPMTFSDLQRNSRSMFNLEIPISIWLVRLLGPKDKIIIRKMKQQYELEFQLYKILTADMSLQQYYNIKLENQIILQQEEQPLITNCISIQPCLYGQ
ncbi:unnamed protein product [Paramecium octaurelia]|uniref:Transmembrane protein n=1 Tax=Paramecium octaurelia TaxID=43137 RepID=A0A8S1WLC0_PAROT|nr:unnamed protein product [Paramecium octaurelia]